MSTEQVTKPHKFLREPRGKLLICIECGKGKKECKCEKNVKCPYCNSKFEETSDLSTLLDSYKLSCLTLLFFASC